MRLKIYHLITACAFLFILSGLFYIQIMKGKYYYRLSTNNRIRVMALDSYRGKIFDRNGVVLADNRSAYKIMVVPQEISDKDELFDFIHKVTKVSKERLLKTYQLRRFAPFAPVEILENVKKESAIILEENRYRYPGLIVQEVFRRTYPQKDIAAHLTGYVGKISREESLKLSEYGYQPRKVTGKVGIEKFYDEFLGGTNGGMQIEVDSRGEQVRLLSLKDPVPGKDIHLSIDIELQRYSAELMDDHIGSIVVMDTHTGEVLSMVSSPSYDPNAFVRDDMQKELQQILRSRYSPILNRAVKGAYPPGSVFKIPVALAALDTRAINANTVFHCPGYYEIANQKFGCLHSHGGQNLIEAIAHSCNVYFYHLGIKLGADVMHKYASKFGLGEKTNIDLPFETAGNLPLRRKELAARRQWYTGDSLNFAIGQGRILTTPLQLTVMMAAIARDGEKVRPQLMKGVGGKLDVSKPVIEKVGIDPKALRAVQQGMRAVVETYSGTAHVLDLKGVYVAGKTGTAQSFGERDSHAWFAGYARGEHKELAFCVFIEHGGSSQNANLIARQLLMKMQEDQFL